MWVRLEELQAYLNNGVHGKARRQSQINQLIIHTGKIRRDIPTGVRR